MDDTIKLFAKYFTSVFTTNIINDNNYDLFNNQLQNIILISFHKKSFF